MKWQYGIRKSVEYSPFMKYEVVKRLSGDWFLDCHARSEKAAERKIKQKQKEELEKESATVRTIP